MLQSLDPCAIIKEIIQKINKIRLRFNLFYETYTCLLPWRLGDGARVEGGNPNNESNTSSSVVEPGDGRDPVGLAKFVAELE